MKYAISFLLLTAGAANAHTGHGADTQAHWLSRGDHLAVIALTAVIIGLGARVLLTRRGRIARKT